MGTETDNGSLAINGRLPSAPLSGGANIQAPHIPDTAPFTAEQRAWLNGFLAGWYSTGANVRSELQTTPDATTPPVTILYGTQTGGAKALARLTGKNSRRTALRRK